MNTNNIIDKVFNEYNLCFIGFYDKHSVYQYLSKKNYHNTLYEYIRLLK